MNRETISFKTEDEWLALRAVDVTSSESSALFGLNPYVTEFSLYHQKYAKQVMEIESTERMRWGNRLEAAIAEGAAQELDMQVLPMKRYMRIPEIRMGSSFDYDIHSGKYKNWIMEIKNVDSLQFKQKWDIENHQATDYIETQVQHQMEVADRPGTLIVALVGGNKIHYIERERDRDVGAALVNRISRFWNDVNSGNEPKPNYLQDAEFIISLHQSSEGEVLDVLDDVDLLEKIKSYADLKEKIKDWTESANAKKAELLDLVGDSCSKVLVKGFNFSCGMTKGTEDSVITEDMVGDTVKGRKAYRGFRITRKAVKK